MKLATVVSKWQCDYCEGMILLWHLNKANCGKGDVVGRNTKSNNKGGWSVEDSDCCEGMILLW